MKVPIFPILVLCFSVAGAAGVAAAANLPIYPGATKMAYSGLPPSCAAATKSRSSLTIRVPILNL
jgi:hypothetical protein